MGIGGAGVMGGGRRRREETPWSEVPLSVPRHRHNSATSGTWQLTRGTPGLAVSRGAACGFCDHVCPVMPRHVVDTTHCSAFGMFFSFSLFYAVCSLMIGLLINIRLRHR